MKRYSILLAATMIALVSQAQIQIKNTDIGKEWNRYFMYSHAMETFFIQPKNPQKGGEWDLYDTKYPKDNKTIVELRTEKSSKYGKEIEGVNFVIARDSNEYLYIKSETGLKLMGYSAYLPNSDGSYTQHLIKLAKGISPLQLTAKFGDAFNLKDSLVYTWTTPTNQERMIRGKLFWQVSGDGYGRVRLPDAKFYDVLRLKIVTNDTIKYMTKLGNKYSLDSIHVDHYTLFEMWGKNFGYPLARFYGTSDNFNRPLWFEVMHPDSSVLSTNEVAQLENAVYPNPFTNELHVVLQNPVSMLRIYSGNGQLVYTANAKNLNNMTLNLADLPKGYYLMQYISEKNGLKSQAIIKN